MHTHTPKGYSTSCVYCLHNQYPLPYYDLFMVARSVLSQPCLQCIPCMRVCTMDGRSSNGGERRAQARMASNVSVALMNLLQCFEENVERL